jgi:hypothetical protein
MRSEGFHLSDQEMLLAADGELSARRGDQARTHLAECWTCRARMAEIERTVADFARAHRQTLDPQLPPIAGPRALLRAQLAKLASERQVSSWRPLFQITSGMRVAAFLCLTVLVVAAVGRFALHPALRRASAGAFPFEGGTVPDRSLTPGATRRVTIHDICSMPHEEVIGEVSMSLRHDVFQEYGIVNADASEYEIDYLIAPGLGGAQDIHNLWPEPYTSRTWNAYVKDALEEHLHQMVCAGELDLSTAQQDIAGNWISAYKKYFLTDKPLLPQSRL